MRPTEDVTHSEKSTADRHEPLAVDSSQLPAVIEPTRAPRRRRLAGPALLVLLAVGLAGIGGAYWWSRNHATLPPGIAWGNGRVEADEIDISTKFAGRVAALFAEEGDLVKAGQVVAQMDVKDLEASLARAQAQVQQAQKVLDGAQSDLAQLGAQRKFADQELQRARELLRRGNIAKEVLDQRQAQIDGTTAAYTSGLARIAQAEHALEAARQDAALIRVNIGDNTLVAPKDGRIEYRLANIGEVLGAGGKVFTMIDTSYVYMDVFLPTAEAGRAVIGTESRIVLDALPTQPIPAKVTYVAAAAQFTPKAVETKSERDKLMFRVRLRIDPDLLYGHAEAVRSGLPGVGYLRLDPRVAWPARLQATGAG